MYSWRQWMTGVAGIFLFILMISVVSVQAQYVSGGTKTFGGPGDEFTTVAVDGSGNIYMAGGFSGTVNFNPGGTAVNRTSNGSVDAFVIKFDKNRNFLWVRTWGGAGRDDSVGLGLDGSGNVYISGKFQQTVDFSPGTSGFSRTTNGQNDIFLVKYDTNGNLKWLRVWGGAFGDDGYSCAVDSAGNVYVVGDFSSNTVNFNTTGGSDIHTRKGPLGSFDAYISKHDTNGNFQWARSWGGGWYTDGPSVAVDGSGNVYVAGMFENTVNFNPGPGVDNHTAHGGVGCTNPGNCPIDVFLSKFDANGNYKWAKTWGGNGNDCGSVNVDPAGNIYVSGYFNGVVDFNPWGAADIHTSISASDTFLSKFDPNGNFQWARTFGGNSSYGGGATAFDSAGNVYIAGPFIGSANFNPNGSDSRTSKGGKDVYLTKFDSSGIYQWTKTWGGTGDDGGYGIAVDRGSSTIYVAGVFSNKVDFNPWGVADEKTSNGGQDVFLSKFTIDTALYAGFTGAGVYKYNGSAWTGLHNVTPARMAAAGTDLYVAFSSYGLFKYNGSAWTGLHNLCPTSIAACGTNVYAAFPGVNGVFKWNGSAWSQVSTTYNPTIMVCAGTNLYAAITGYGLYKYNGTTWSGLHNLVPVKLAVSGADLYAAFTNFGLFKYNGTAWSGLHNLTPTSIAACGTDLYAAFSGVNGIFKWNGSAWSQVSTTYNPTIMVCAGVDLYTALTGNGAYKYNGSVWTGIHNLIPTSMAAGN